MAESVKVPLGHGHFALVDSADAQDVLRYRWNLRRAKNGRMYAQRTVSLHAHLMPEAALVDHEDGDGLNCRRSNLRAATVSQNNANRGKTSRNTSGYKGVTFDRASGKWRAQIQTTEAGKRHGHALGYFADLVTAAQAYDAAATRYFGEFARLNFPPEAQS